MKRKPILVYGHIRINGNLLSGSFLKMIVNDIFSIEVNDTPNIEKMISRVKRKLDKESFYILIKTEECKWDRIWSRYQIISKMGVDLSVPCFDSYYDLRDTDFLKWAYDMKGSRLIMLYELCKKYLEGYSGWDDCYHNSCLGKYIFIKRDGQVHWCRKIYDGNKCMNIDEISSFSEIFNNEKFISIINESINRRNICKEKCELFEQCKGGCPVKNSGSLCRESAYKDYYNIVIGILEGIIENEDYGRLNPCLRRLIFSSMTSGRLLAERYKIYEG